MIPLISLENNGLGVALRKKVTPLPGVLAARKNALIPT